MNIKIAAVQMEITPWDLQANYEKIKQYFALAEKNKCNFICFPEECWVGLGYTQIAQPFSGPIKIFKNNREKVLIQTIDTSVVEQARIGWRIRGN